MDSIGKLKWRCRRGTKELDYLLTAYLDGFFSQANEEEQLLFLELLKLQDTQLIDFLLGDQLPESESLAELVKTIRKNKNI